MRRPFVWWSALFAAGIVLEGALSFGLIGWTVLACLAGALAVGRRGAMAAGMAAAVVLMAAGGWWHARALLSLEDGLDAFVGDEPVLVTGVVVETPEPGPDRTYYVLRLTAVAPSVGDGEAGHVLRRRPRVRVAVAGPPRFAYGDVVQARLVLQRPGPATNPGAFDYEAYLHRRGITATAFVRYPRHATVVGKTVGNPFVGWAGAIRTATVDALYEALSEGAARLAAGLALGDRRGMAPGAEEAFRRAGVSHLLSVSGMHVGFMAAAAGGLLRALRIRGRLGAAAASAAVWAYVLITGARPPAVRAGVAATIGLWAFGVGRRTDSATVLAAAALALMVQNPLVVYDVSFQLSFAAAGAIAAGFRPLQSALQRIKMPKGAASAVALALSAQWGVLPLVARVFNEVSTVGLVAGLASAPLVGALVPGALVVAALHRVAPWAARSPALLVEAGASGLKRVSESFAALPWASVPVLKPSLPFIASVWLFGLLLVRGNHWPPRRRRLGFALVAVLLAANLSVGLIQRPPGVELVVIDVGQGDAMFIRTGTGVTALVDGGGTFQPEGAERVPNTGTDVVIPYLRHRGVRRIDVIVNTHPHEDHLQGLLPVVEQFPVALAVDAGFPAETSLWSAYESLLEERRVPRLAARSGDVIHLDPATYLEVLHPGPVPMEGTRSDPNNNSVVLRLVHGDAAALLTGDIETEAQLHLLRSRADVRADVLKVPHHGSRHGLVTAFYEAVGARVAVIPVGANSHGHPSEELMETLHRLGAAVYRTDVHGAVTLTSDGRSWSVSTMSGGGRKAAAGSGN